MTVTGLMVTLPQMVDLALGSPEVGAVNFNLLNAVLQVIIKEMNLNGFLVEYHGPDSDRLENILSTASPGTTLKITEPSKSLDVPPLAINRHLSEKEVKQIDRRKNSTIEPDAGPLSSYGESRVIRVEPSQSKSTTHIPQIVVGVSQNYLQMMTEDIDELKNKMEEILELPNNATLIQAVRTKGGEKVNAVSDMWQALNISKRVDAVEKGLLKISSMVEDLIHDVAGVDMTPTSGRSGGPASTTTGSGGGRLKAGGDEDTPPKASGGEDTTMNSPTSESDKRPRPSIFSDLVNKTANLETRVRNLENNKTASDTDLDKNVDTAGLLKDISQLKNKMKAVEQDLTTITKSAKGKSFGDVFKELEDLKSKIGDGVKKDAGADDSKKDKNLSTIEVKLSSFGDKLNTLDDKISTKFVKMQDQVTDLEVELSKVLEKVNIGGDDARDTNSLGDLYSKILKQQEEIENMTKVADTFKELLEEKQVLMDVLSEQIEVLKTSKADREDLEDALADKADTQIVNRKVSHDQFDAAYDDINKNVEETLNKLTQQEQMWHSTLEELQTSIGTKLDRYEFDPLKDFVNKKIKNLHERLKTLLSMKQEQEAAGTKSKIMQNVNCISCDKEVVMYRDNKFPTFSTPAPLPGSKSIKPYITYELDAVRKQQRSLTQGGRNMNHLESALQEKPSKEKTPIEKNIPPGHLCNRYCGGSHTMTLPQQRVAHVGHFLQQWGPHAVPLDESQAVGTDGQMYKTRGDPNAPKKVLDKNLGKDSGKKSMLMQTEEPKESVPRMSKTLVSTGRSDQKLLQRRSTSGAVQPTSSPVDKRESVDASDKPGAPSRESLSKSRPRRKSERNSRTSTGRRSSSARKDVGARHSLKKGSQAHIKRLSEKRASVVSQKENTPPAPAADEAQKPPPENVPEAEAASEPETAVSEPGPEPSPSETAED